MGVILALVNQKGGCGKTTTAIHLAAALARRDVRVLLVDMDPQGHASMGLGVEPAVDRPSISEILTHTPLTGVGPGLEQAIQAARPGLDIIPGNLGLAGLESRLATVPGREERLAEHLSEIGEGWDVVLIDSPPNLGLLTINALVAAGEALIPLEPSPFTVQGIERLLETIKVVQDHTGHQINPRVLPTMVSSRDPYALELIDRLNDSHPGLLLPVRIRRSVLFPRAASVGKTVGELSSQAPAWKDYMETADFLSRAFERAMAEGRMRFMGLRVVPGGVEYTHPDLEPGDVLLAGEFNNWVPDHGVELRDRGATGWSKFLRLAPGRYQYKFIVRGEWLPDPVNPRRASNSVGTENSVVDVPVSPSPRAPSPRLEIQPQP